MPSSSQVGHGTALARKEPMATFARSAALRLKLGNEGLIELDDALDTARQHWKEQVLETATDRFERRLTEEMSGLRLEIADLRLELAKDIAASQHVTLRWMVGLLIGQAGVIIGTVFAMMTFFVK